MLGLIEKLLHSETMKLGMGLVALMAVNIVLGAVHSLFESNFNFQNLFKGIAKALIVIISFCTVYIVGLLNQDILSLDLKTGDPVDVIDGMHALLLAGYFKYAKQFIKKMQDIINSPSSTQDELPQEAKSEQEENSLTDFNFKDLP